MLVLICSASVAVTLEVRKSGPRKLVIAFWVITAVFIYTTAVNVIERPDGIRIAGFFIAAIVITSLISRAARSTELRVEDVVLDEMAQRLVKRATRNGVVRIIANHPDARTSREYLRKERAEREASNIPRGDPVLFLEVTVGDASQFAARLQVVGDVVEGHAVLRVEGAAIPNTIAAVLLHLQDTYRLQPHIYFGWTEGNPLKYLAKFILFGEGDVAPVTHEILRRAEPDPKRRPALHVG